jgi:hypothetical protein
VCEISYFLSQSKLNKWKDILKASEKFNDTMGWTCSQDWETSNVYRTLAGKTTGKNENNMGEGDVADRRKSGCEGGRMGGEQNWLVAVS